MPMPVPTPAVNGGFQAQLPKAKNRNTLVIVLCSCAAIIAIIIAAVFFMSEGSGQTSNPLELHDRRGNVIYYGMERSEAERILGTGERGMLMNSIYYRSGISIIYRDDIAVMIAADIPGWQTSAGAQIGRSTDDQLFRLYENILPDIYPYSVFLDQNRDPISVDIDAFRQTGIDFDYCITFYTREEDRNVLYMIMIGDRQALTRYN
jgi:hypothetical protein